MSQTVAGASGSQPFNPVGTHDFSFAGIGLKLFPSMLAFGWAFRQSSAWRGLSTYTWLTAALAVPTFAVKGVAFYVFLAMDRESCVETEKDGEPVPKQAQLPSPIGDVRISP